MNASEPDLIDRIANALPEEIRSDYYRELLHCRSLPENDEMLRILRAMQFLTLLMTEVPARVITQRESLEKLFGETVKKIQESLHSSEEYQKQLDKRLVGLPDQIAKGISPAVIAGNINESLRQQFVNSTIPKTAQALANVAEHMKKTTAEFGHTAATLTDSFHGAAERARQTIDGIESSVSRAATAAKAAAENLAQTFSSAYWWFLAIVAISALAIGFFIGMLFQRWVDQPPEPTINESHMPAPSPQPMPHIKKKP
jgi:ElaB/YqjD/DUF883 family membrane-anchored ribosome-binding protein